jgi:enolase
MKVTKIQASQIPDPKGNPAVEAEVTINDKFMERGISQLRASKGEKESAGLRDGDEKR